MTQALSARALDVVGAAAPLWWGADGQSRRRLLAAPVAVVEGGVDRRRHVARCSARSSATACSACRARGAAANSTPPKAAAH